MADTQYKQYIIEFKLYDGTTRKIPIEIPMGEDGGFYTPATRKVSDTEIEISFTPSKDGMPAVEPVQVTLPAGTGSGGNVDLNWLDPEEGEVFTSVSALPDEPDVPDIPDEPDEPVNPEVTLTSISATYTGGNVAVGTAMTALTGVTVTAHYSDGSSETVTGYTLSGTIAEGSNTITVSYGGKTTTFVVTGEVEEEQEQIGQEGRTIIGDDGYAYLDVMTIPSIEISTYIDRTVASSGFATFTLNSCPMIADTTSEVLFKDKFTYLGTSYSGIRNGTSSPEVQYGYGYDGEGGSILIRIPYSDYESVGAAFENISSAIALHCRYLPFKLKDSYNTYSITEEAIDAATYYILPELYDDGIYRGFLYISNGGTNVEWVASDNRHYLCNYGGLCGVSGYKTSVERYTCDDDTPKQRINVVVPEGAIADATTLDGWKAFLKSRLPIEWYGE